MRRIQMSFRATSLLLAAVFGTAALVTGVSTASRAILAQPTSVVTINIPSVLEKLDQRERAEMDLQEMAARMQSEDEAKQSDIKDLQARLSEIPDTNLAQRQSLGEELALKVLEFEAWRQFATEQLDIEKSLMLRDLDRSIRAAIEELALANGYDIVVMDDTGQELTVAPDSNMPRELQVKQQMVSRRVLYKNPAVDVTDALISRMNNAFNAGN
jgi:Skp family chaperone for outer membrane proteins